MKAKIVILCIGILIVLMMISWRNDYNAGTVVNVENVTPVYNETVADVVDYYDSDYLYGNTVIETDMYSETKSSYIPVGLSALCEIGDGLWYDTTTKIVYWWNGAPWREYYTIAPSAYLAPNGKPYRYNTETNTLEEIKE